MKQANGLPRFMMDCGWWRNGRRWRRPTLAELGLQHAAVSFANEHGTDGVLPGPSAEDLALALSLPLAEVRKTMPRLLAREAWVGRPDGDFEIVGFLDHNPSRREVTADRRKRQVASEIANHQRHHVKKNVSDPDCVYCSDSESEPESQSDSEADSNKEVRNGRKEETNLNPLSSTSDLRPSAEPVDDEQRVHATLKAITDRRVAEHAAGPVPNMAGYRRAVAAGVAKDFKPSAYLLARQHPDWLPERLAVTLDPPPKPSLAVVAVENTRLGGIAQWLAEGAGA